MTKKLRRSLFFSLLALFIIAVPLILLHSQGYRFDFEKKKVLKTGAFYFKVLPSGVEIYLNEKLKKKTSFLGSAFIENLLPKKYEIELRKEGYHPWKKNLEIKETKVTEAKNVVLWPENPKFEILEKGVKDFYFSPIEQKIILSSFMSEEGEKEAENGWFLKVLDEERAIIPSFPSFSSDVKLLDLNWSLDAKRILLKISEKEQIKNFVFDIDENKLISLDFLGRDAERIFFHPKDISKIFFLRNKNLYLADFSKKEVNSEPLLKNLITYEVFPNNIIWLAGDGFCYKSDFSGRILEVLNLKPSSVKTETKYKIFGQNQNVFLEEGLDLLYLNPNSRNFEKVFDSLSNLKFSPDYKKAVFTNNREIWLLFLEKIYDQLQKESGEKLFLTRFSEKIDQIFWLNSHYLIFNTGNKLKIAEIDERDRINIIDLAEFKNPTIYFSKKSLYILSNENLYSLEKLIP